MYVCNVCTAFKNVFNILTDLLSFIKNFDSRFIASYSKDIVLFTYLLVFLFFLIS